MKKKLFSVRYSSNCGMELFSFDYHNPSITPNGAVTGYEGSVRKFSYKLIAEAVGPNRHNNPRSLILFSGSTSQREDPCGPHAFAKWLKKKGEEVFASPSIRNRNTGNNIQAYFWHPSKEFRAELRKEQNKLPASRNSYY